MFDVKAIRDNPAAFDAGLKRRGIDKEFSSQRVIELDDRRKAILTSLQEMQARRNAASKEIGKAMGAKDTALADKLKAEVAGLKDKIAAGEDDARKIDKEVDDYLAVIPNTPLDEVPFGTDETGNTEVRRWGDPVKLGFAPKQHFELGEALGMMDFETAQKVSGARFVFLKGGLARLERALAQFMLDIHTEEFGYTEVVPPLLVRTDAAYGTGNLPKFEDDLFQVPSVKFEQIMKTVKQKIGERTDKVQEEHRKRFGKEMTVQEVIEGLLDALETNMSEYRSMYEKVSGTVARHWLIPTAEVPLTNLAREQILDEDKLPLRFTAHTPCFRSEAGAAGKDTRGMIRQHQFSKVELVSITTPEKGIEEHERMTKVAEAVLQRLKLPYRTMLLCTGDMGFASQKTYDIEVWLPGQDTYREISSCSVCGDFQARRMSARYRPKGSKEVRYVTTLNGSGLAVGRTLVAVLENYQQADGSIRIPEALVPYMGGKTVIAKG